MLIKNGVLGWGNEGFKIQVRKTGGKKIMGCVFYIFRIFGIDFERAICSYACLILDLITGQAVLTKRGDFVQCCSSWSQWFEHTAYNFTFRITCSFASSPSRS
jgi:hypothetical protein